MKHLPLIVILFHLHVANGKNDSGSPFNVLDPIPYKSYTDKIADKVNFWYYNQSNPDEPTRMWQRDNKTYYDSGYTPQKETVFITHGWLSDGKGDSCMKIKEGYLSHADYNVIVVDWSYIAKNKNYAYAASRVKAVGKYVAGHINFLVMMGSKPDNIHLVGHSLGAHVMGLAGYQAEHKVAHVVALDPASPGFENQKPSGRVSTESGDYVEVIHTNAGFLGIAKAIGLVDYYPNGGRIMPGCEIDTEGSCSHSRAYYYYQESMQNPEKWYARLCDSYTKFILGKCNKEKYVQFPRWTAKGIKRELHRKYYLRTNSESPYGLGISGTKPKYDKLTKPFNRGLNC